MNKDECDQVQQQLNVIIELEQLTDRMKQLGSQLDISVRDINELDAIKARLANRCKKKIKDVM
jgi:hypothetical protein